MQIFIDPLYLLDILKMGLKYYAKPGIGSIYNQLCDRIPLNKIKCSRVYSLQCKTCNKSNVGQTGRSIEIRHREYTRYIKTNNPIAAYAFHILNNRHDYGNPEQTM
jgi:hypothetical protein